MKTLLAIPFVLLIGMVAFFVFVLDQWMGLAAFTYPYLLFCVVVSLLLSVAWFVSIRKGAVLFGLVVFGVLAGNLFLPPPSARLLRSSMLKLPPGTNAEVIETVVRKEYEGSVYALPKISRDRAQQYDRVHVSLLSQKAGDCTAIIFLIEDGTIVRSIFSAD